MRTHVSSKIRERLAALAASRSAPWIAAALGCVLSAPALSIGLLGDDEAHRLVVRTRMLSPDAPGAFWDMFDAGGRGGALEIPVRVFNGALPWWTSPDLSLAFFRPLSAATHYLDYALWPDDAWLMHAQNLLLYGLTVLLVSVYYRRVLGSGAVAGLAALLYAVDEAHVEGAAWIAGRNTVLTAMLAALVLVLHDQARRDAARRAGRLMPLALLLALAASEGAVAIWAYLVAHALCLDRAPPSARLRSLIPAALVTTAYLGLVRGLGYGVRSSGIYLDPLAEPGRFARAALTRLPEVLREQFTLPAMLGPELLPDALQPGFALVLFALLALVLVLGLPGVVRCPSARFFALGAVLSALPVCAVGVTPRLLFITGIGAHGLIAEMVVAAARDAAVRTRMRAVALRVVAVVLLLMHGFAAFAIAPITPLVLARHDRAARAAALTLPFGPGPSAVLLLNTTNFFHALLVRTYVAAEQAPAGTPALMHVLGASATPVRMQRVDRNAIVLEPQGGYLLEPWSHMVRRPDERFAEGQRVLLFGMVVTVERTSPDGRPARVRFDLADAEDPRVAWVFWHEAKQRFERLALPQVGGVVVLPGAARAAR